MMTGSQFGDDFISHLGLRSQTFRERQKENLKRKKEKIEANLKLTNFKKSYK